MEILRYALAALTRNWGLKLLALALAVIIYHSMKPADGSRGGKQHDRHLLQEKR